MLTVKFFRHHFFNIFQSPLSWPYHYKEGENETSIFMEGRWTKVPKNPARHLRALSSNYLKHATWTLAWFIKISFYEKKNQELF